MSDQSKQEAAEKAARAGTQFKHAAKNVGGAAEAGAEYVKDEVVDGVETVTDGVKAATNRVQPHVVAYAVRQVGWGFVAMSLSVYTGAIAANKFKTAFDLRKQFMASRS